MKIIAKLFGKKTGPSETITANNPSNQDDGSYQIHLDKGSAKIAAFFDTSKSAIYLGILLALVVGLIGFRFFLSSNNEVPQMPASETALAPKLTVAQDLADKNSSTLIEAKKLFDEKEFEESVTAYEKLVKNNPRDAQALNDLGVVYLKQRKLAESEEQLKKSLEINPKCFTCLNNLGYLKTLQGRDEEAEAYLKKAIAVSEDYLDPYFNLGVLYEKNGDLANSANAYSEFLRRSDNREAPFNKQLEQHLQTLRGK